MRRLRTALLLAPALAAACAGNPDRRTLAELRDVEPDVTRGASREQPRPGDGRVQEVPRGSAGVRAHAGGDAAPRGSEAREGVRHPRRREDRGASGPEGRRPAKPPRTNGPAPRNPRRARSPTRTSNDAPPLRRGSGRRAAARRSSCPTEGRRRWRGRSRPSSSTTRSSPTIRTTRTTTRCCTRSRARSTSSGASTRRSPSWSG